MVEAEKVKLGVTRLLGLQDYFKLSPLLGYKVCRPLDDVMGLDGCRLGRKRQRISTSVKLTSIYVSLYDHFSSVEAHYQK